MKTLLALSLAALVSASARADDWPGWRGADRTGVSREAGLLKAWPKEGPKRLWLFKDAGSGYSGVAVVGDTLYTMGARGQTEYLIAVNVKDGSQRWATGVGPRSGNGIRWADGPRGTPTVDGGQVVALGGQGNLVCVNANDGKVTWEATLSTFGGASPEWGYCESVLVDGDAVVCTPGGRQGAIVALDRRTGKPRWRTKGFTEPAQYSSVLAYNHNGQRQYAYLALRKVVGLDAGTGAVLWSSDFPGKNAVIATPIYAGGCLFVTCAYGIGCRLLEVGQDRVTQRYASKSMSNQHGGVLLVGEHLYGYSEPGGWTCMEFKTGKVVWAERNKLGKGSLTCAGGMLYLLGERGGEVVLIDASPRGWKEHGRFKLHAQARRNPQGWTWTHPVVSGGRLYLRDQELLSCYDVKAP